MVVARDPIVDLERRLRKKAPRGSSPRAAVRTWWRDQGFATHPAAVGVRVALAVAERGHPHAAIIVLGELLADRVRASDLPALSRALAAGHFSAALVPFATRVLGALLARDDTRTASVRALATWRRADSSAQRRAACLALATIAPQADRAITDACLLVCADCVWSHEPADQAAVGHLLHALSTSDPVVVEAFVRRYARLMSRACVRRACLGLAARAELLAHHRRATTIRK